MADKNDRNSKAAKRAVVQAVSIESGKRTHIADPLHIAYTERGIYLGHLTRRARKMLGFEPEYSALDA